jgi:MtN3 and saliva related transmembrane protein
MQYTTLIGFAAAILTTIAFVPQVLHILRSGNVEGISIAMYSVLISGVSLWLVYGIILDELPIILANSITLVLTITVVILTIYKRSKKS